MAFLKKSRLSASSEIWRRGEPLSSKLEQNTFEGRPSPILVSKLPLQRLETITELIHKSCK
jgi:hypothetical protein